MTVINPISTLNGKAYEGNTEAFDVCANTTSKLTVYDQMYKKNGKTCEGDY
ncbi:hypothetical protein DPMN_189599 [Dreissena polymorpha]|uniref:Uncharacterized protein n=1 Tax=Dreissena polymorpha TaxID=45954 RepID=A0A9D4DSR8_DREPO|nr:hypothetical protein DPMN_189599 [Dreissena polymorpha]